MYQGVYNSSDMDHSYAELPDRTKPDLNNVVAEEIVIAQGDDLDFEIENSLSCKLEGRALVDLELLLSLKCRGCNLALDTKNCTAFLPQGISGYMDIQCNNPLCDKSNKVPLGKMHKESPEAKGRPTFDSNSKFVLGRCSIFTVINCNNIMVPIDSNWSFQHGYSFHRSHVSKTVVEI